VESIHSTIETELYDLERFGDVDEFLAKAATYQLWYNIARKNPDTRCRGWKSPLDLLEEKVPELDARLLLLHPVLLNRLRLTAPTRDAPVAHHLPIHPGSRCDSVARLAQFPWRTVTNQRTWHNGAFRINSLYCRFLRRIPMGWHGHS